MKILILAFVALLLNASPMKPQYSIETSDMVTDLFLEGSTLYAATGVGVVDVIDTINRKRVETITLPSVKDFLGDLIPPKIYSIDKVGSKIVLVSQGKSGYRDVYIKEGEKLRRIIDSSKEFFIKKGLFVDENRIILGLLSSEIILYDIQKETVIYRHAIKERNSGGSALGDMVLSEDKKILVTADESGEVNYFKVENFDHIKVNKGQNLDNIYKIDYKKGTVITAGQDRRCAIYKDHGSPYYVSGEFLIYAAGLSPSGKIGVFASTIENALQVFDIKTKRKLALLEGHNATLTDFAFVNETSFYSSADENRILFWNLNK
ncbi:MAG: WD40 repeat domain-containing protein [Campylobacterota bacterium]|nr:WD40 repeat domain-containing protein [Campylobacterota bacterium]